MTLPPARKSPIAEALTQTGETQMPPETPKSTRRARLWELGVKYHCPLIGTCMTMEELVWLARRHNLNCDLHDEFSLHVEAVAWAGSRNPVSRDLNRLFEQKYASYIARFDRVTSADELRSLWKELFENGEVAGPMWAALTHKAANEETRHVVYADVHMLSHKVAARLAAKTKHLAWLARRNEELAAALERSRTEAAQTESEKRRLEVELKTARAAEAVARSEVAELRERLEAYESGEAFMEMSRRLTTLQETIEELRPVAERAHQLQAQLKRLQEEVATLQRERDTLAAERDALERLLLAGENGDDRCDGKCDGCDRRATGRCVLCVGGRTALLSQYRALAERLGIRLIHHDGGLEDSLSRLPNLIDSADAVLCPTDCVSHNAYYTLKQHCKRSGKPCLLFKGAGVASFAVALVRLSAGQVSIAESALANE
jgi:hypothetical protein